MPNESTVSTEPDIQLVRLLSRTVLGKKATSQTVGAAYLTPCDAERMNNYQALVPGAYEFYVNFASKDDPGNRVAEDIRDTLISLCQRQKKDFPNVYAFAPHPVNMKLIALFKDHSFVQYNGTLGPRSGYNLYEIYTDEHGVARARLLVAGPTAA